MIEPLFMITFKGEKLLEITRHLKDILQKELLDRVGEARNVQARTVPEISGEFVRVHGGGH